MKKNKDRSPSFTPCKHQFKIDGRPSYKLKLAEENAGTRCQDISMYKYSFKRIPRIDN